jgi:hypothetical protein
VFDGPGASFSRKYVTVIEVPELGDGNHETWAVLATLAAHAPAPWTLIGAQMVGAHAWLRGRNPLRATRDADVLVDARAVAHATAAFSEALEAEEFELDQPSRSGQGFRFRRRGVVIDVLAPDGLGARARLVTLGRAHTVAVPGGSQALGRSDHQPMRSRDVDGVVPIPNLLGALLITVRAIAVDDAPSDKRKDAAFLLSLVEDPVLLDEEIETNERGWLRRHAYLADPGFEAWEGIDDPELGASVFLRLARL